MKIDRHNCEEYFILYMDNELSSEDRRQVESFVQLHPDLKEELDLLIQFKITPDDHIVFAGKEDLLRINGEAPITPANYEEWFTLYTDDELTIDQKWAVEQFIAENPALEKELALLQKTRLQPEEVVFPHKELLYREVEKVRVIPVRWWRIAAAAVLLLGIGFGTYTILNKKSATDKDNLAGSGDQIKESKIPVVAPKENNAVVNSPLAGEEDKKGITTLAEQKNSSDKTIRRENNLTADNKEVPGNRNNTVAPVAVNKDEQGIADHTTNQPSNNLPEPVNNPYLKPIRPSDAIAEANTKKENVNLGTDQVGVVTNRPSTPSDIIQASSKENDVAFEKTDGKKNKLRGFFRKVTRTFEKRTNNDDDDKLLIAGLSIKLR